MEASERVARLAAAGVSPEEARAALAESGDDLLEAALLLERRGRLSPPAGGGGFDSTRRGSGGTPPPAGGARGRQGKVPVLTWSALWQGLKSLLHKSLVNHLEISRKGRVSTTVPLLVLLILLFFFWATLPILAAGFVLGFRYRFAGPDLNRESLERAADWADRTAGTLGDSLREAWRKGRTDHHKK